MNLSYRASALRRDALGIMRHAIDGVEPERLTARALSAFPPHSPVRVVSAGKAAAAMARAAAKVFGTRIVDGLLITPGPASAAGFENLIATHPLPTAASELAGRRALMMAGAVTGHEQLVCLISGGASALMAVPADGVSLADKVEATSTLMRAGADIYALNTVRKHLSNIKGGGLARRSVTGCHTLAVSDVIGDDIDAIGSGPGVPDHSTFADAIAVLHRFGGQNAFPAAVVTRLENGARGLVADTLKTPVSDMRITSAVVGGRRDAMDAARDAAAARGYRVAVIDEPIVGEARVASRAYIATVRQLVQHHMTARICIISSGETTVNVTGSGRGGRNQEFALAAAVELALRGPDGLLLSIGTDGIDGPTTAAGACADRGSVARGRSQGLDAHICLESNDSFEFFHRLNDLVVTGPTGTNVGDLQIFLTGTTDASC